MLKYKLVIFDFDGTLADTYHWFTSIMNQVADKYKFRRVAQNEYKTLRELSARRVMQHLGISMWKMPFISNHVRRLMARDLHGGVAEGSRCHRQLPPAKAGRFQQRPRGGRE